MTVHEASLPGSPARPYVVVMGVSGTGKTTTAQLLAARLEVPFADADDLHPPANIAKMSAGIPLADADREPWLIDVGHWLHDRGVAGTGGVIACSALKQRYRDTLRAAAPRAFFLLLTVDRDELVKRLRHRRGHHMPVSLIDSQLATLEPLQSGERGATLVADQTPHAVAATAAALVREPWASVSPPQN